MWTAIFAVVAIVCGIGWLKQYISTLAIIYYIEKKGYIQPTDSEIKECTLWAAKHFLSNRTRKSIYR